MSSDTMKNLRFDLLNGNSPDTCHSCKNEDQYGKVSGRQRQLLKSAIQLKNFDKMFCASPHYDQFSYSWEHQGDTNCLPVDLQIDLGNTCNSACVMCVPTYSSKLATDYIYLHQRAPQLFSEYDKLQNWADDSDLVDKFVTDLTTIPNIQYIHFLGGETLYLKSFYSICDKLIDLGLAKDISLGTTTNCTVYTPALETIIKEFKHVHLGLSVEAIHEVNDYIRWPSKIQEVTKNIKKFIGLRQTTNLHLSLRITPNILSVYHLDTIFEFMLENSIIAESCNVLRDPPSLQIELLPNDLLAIIKNKINIIISKYKLIENNNLTVNRRRDDLKDRVIVDVIFEYKKLFETLQIPNNVEEQRYNLVKFLQAFEELRGNNILTYLPEYEEFLRSYGY